jgi:biotin carboxyl carrier protein
MKLDVTLNANHHAVDASIEANRVRGTIDGNAFEADAVEVSPGIYSVLIEGCAFEVRVEQRAEDLQINTQGREYSAAVRDPRQWLRRNDSALEAQGRQKVIAPMPGKIVRLLVGAGDRVEAGQSVLVVEAMKMQNEVRSPKSGKVEKLFVSEGQAVTAGETLGFIA